MSANNQDTIETTAQETVTQATVARLRNVPTSPRKMRLVVDNIRGMEVERAMATLRFSSRRVAAQRVEQLIRSAVSNWEQLNGRKADEGELYVSKVYVDEGVTLKRLRPAPQGRGYRIRKRSNHITVWVDQIVNNVAK
nr:50S ribosomal protein L22 [uncultured Porphyromonas sp.]